MRRERGIRAGDQVGQHGDERRVLGGEPDGLVAGGVDDPDAIVGEIGDLDDPRAGIGGKACRDVRAVLLVCVLTGQVDRVGDGLDQGGGLRAETGGQHAQCPGAAAGSGQVVGVVFHRVVQQRRADDVGVADAVMADDPQRDPQQVVDVRFALAPVCSMQAPGQLQRFADLLPAGRVVKPPGLDGQPRPQPLLAVNSGDGMQRHLGEDLLLVVGNVSHVQVQVSRMMVTACLTGNSTE